MNDKEIRTTIVLFMITIWGLFILILPIYSIIPSIYNNCLYSTTVILLLSSLSISYLISKNTVGYDEFPLIHPSL